MINKKFVNPFKGKKNKIFEILYWAVMHSEENLIEKAEYKNLDIEETADIPQSINNIRVYNSSIGTTLEINNKLCTNLDKF